MGVGARTSVTSTVAGSSPRWWVVRSTDARTCWVCAPRALRLPPQTLRSITAGRIAGSARQLVASIAGSPRNVKRAAASTVRWATKRRTAGRVVRVVQQVEHRREQPAPRAGEPVGRHLAGGVSIAQRQALRQAPLDPPRKRTAGMVGLEVATPPSEMRQTRLMVGMHEAAVRGPAIAHEPAGNVLAQDRRRLGRPTPRANGIDGGVRRRERPQPVPRGRHAPPRLVGTDDRTAADVRTQRVVGRGGTGGRACTDMDQGAPGHAQAEPVAQERDDVREWQAHPLVQDHDQRRGLGADLHRCRPQCVRGLQRVPPLHASATPRTRAHVDAKLADEGTDDRQIFLILRDHVRVVQTSQHFGSRGLAR